MERDLRYVLTLDMSRSSLKMFFVCIDEFILYCLMLILKAKGVINTVFISHVCFTTYNILYILYASIYRNVESDIVDSGSFSLTFYRLNCDFLL